ncbi:MAG TPA: hypothetical protein VHE61_23335 [Opitutaceae bacterium]|nr:hypothetical protein [Opitutaceae bacterium]
MNHLDYLVELKVSPAATVPTPQEGIAFTERFVLPTIEACERHAAEGRIVAGGPTLAGLSFAFVARVATPQELERLVSGLPIWPRAQTTVTPLGSFSERGANVRQRLAAIKGSLAGTADVATRN